MVELSRVRWMISAGVVSEKMVLSVTIVGPLLVIIVVSPSLLSWVLLVAVSDDARVQSALWRWLPLLRCCSRRVVYGGRSIRLFAMVVAP